MITIDLAKGGRTTVDQKDFEMLSQYKWHLVNGEKVGTWIDDKLVYMHWLVMGYYHWGFLATFRHLNGHSLDNREGNIAVDSIFMGSSKSGRIGIHWRKSCSKWRVIVYAEDKKQVYIGVFASLAEAVRAQDEAIKERGLSKARYIRGKKGSGKKKKRMLLRDKYLSSVLRKG